MKNIYKNENQLRYIDVDEDLSRWLCRISDEPQEDLTSEADWFIDARYLSDFLASPNDAIVERDPHTISDPNLRPIYSISEISSFVVCSDRAIALFKRDDNGKFVYNQTYTFGRDIPQEFWEAMYPDTYERAIAKIYGDFFSNDLPIWYFVGKDSGELYRVTPDMIIPCDTIYDAEGDDATYRIGVKDGLSPSCFHEANLDHCYAYFDSNAVEETDYAQSKLDTPESLIVASKTQTGWSTKQQLLEGYRGVLTDDEYYCAVTILKERVAS